MNGKSLLYPIQLDLIDYIFDHVSDKIFIMDNNRSFIKVNGPADLLLKKVGGAKNLQELYEKLSITDFSGVPKSVEDGPVSMVFKGDHVINAEICVHWEKDVRSYYHMDAMPFQDNEEREFAIVILKEITDYFTLEALKNQFQKKAEELENIINTISDGVAIIDSLGNYKLLNPACNEIFEYKGKIDEVELKAGAISKYANIMDVDGTRIEQENQPIFKVLGGESVRNEIYKIDINERTKYISFNGIPVLNSEGDVDYAVICYSDVSELQRQKSKYAQQKQVISNLFDGLGAPVAAVSYPECRFILVNEGYCGFIEQLVGIKYKGSDLMGKTFREALPATMAASFYRDVENMVMGKITEQKIIEYLDSKGESRFYQIVHSPMFDENGQIEYITAVGIEVTEEVKAKTEAEALAKMKEEYFTVISHELRSPIAVVHSAVQMLTSDLYEGQFSGPTEKMLNRIEKNTYRLLGLVNNFLDITKAEAGFMTVNYSVTEIGSLTETLMESLQPAAVKKSIQLKLTNECKTQFVNVDIEKYERILLNLLTNAIKFTDLNGKVSLHLMEDEHNIIIRIKDDGIGIPEEEIDKIFDRFYIIDGSMSRSNNGTGIGLSLVKKLVEVIKGNITVNSQVGIGSEFILQIPKITVEENRKSS